MPHIIYTAHAVDDLVRLASFLKTRSPEVAKRAILLIKSEIEKARIHPERFRPVPDLPHYREIIIDFGAYGYVARFRQESGATCISCVSSINGKMRFHFRSSRSV